MEEEESQLSFLYHTVDVIHVSQYSLSSEFLADWSLQSFVLLTLRFCQNDKKKTY